MFIKSGQTKLISSEFAQKIPTNLAVITSRFLLKFHKIGWFYSKFVFENPA